MNGFTGTSLQLQSITTAHSQWLSTTRSIPCWTTNSSLPLWRMSLSLSLMLRPTVSLGIKHPYVAYGQIFITVIQLRVCWCGALSKTKRRVYRLQLLLALASTVILGSESRGTRDRILLSQIRDFLFRRLLRLARLRWRYSISPPHGAVTNDERRITELTSKPTEHRSPSQTVRSFYIICFVRCYET
jgi:hypothetical protein